jgi:hypothetical protein
MKDKPTEPVYMKAKREFCVGPDKSIVAIEKGQVCRVLSTDGTKMMVEPKRGGFFGYTNCSDWELVKA